MIRTLGVIAITALTTIIGSYAIDRGYITFQNPSAPVVTPYAQQKATEKTTTSSTAGNVAKSPQRKGGDTTIDDRIQVHLGDNAKATQSNYNHNSNIANPDGTIYDVDVKVDLSKNKEYHLHLPDKSLSQVVLENSKNYVNQPHCKGDRDVAEYHRQTQENRMNNQQKDKRDNIKILKYQN